MTHAIDAIHWPRTACPPPDCAPLKGDIRADVLVVGGGLTGCRTALGLAEAGVSVALVDAREIGWGASGRSGGQCNPMWRQTPAELAGLIGPGFAQTLVRTTLSAADDLFADIRKYRVDCDPVQAGWLQVAHTTRAWGRMRSLGAAWRDAGADIAEMEGDALQTASGSPAYRHGLRHAAGGHVQPLSLTRGYARAAAERGARLFSHAPVTALDRIGTTWRASAGAGTVTADTVVLATNGYTDDLWPGLRQSIHPLVSVSLATAPLSAAQRAEILPGSVTLADTRMAIYYCRYDRDGRLVFGCMGSGDRVDLLGGYRRLRRGLATVFPQLSATAIERKWAGRIAVTPQMMPHLHEPAPGLLAGLGYSGRGIAMSSVMGRALAARILGAAEIDLPFPISPIRPEPLHALTRRLIPFAAPALALKDRLEVMLDRR